MAAAINAYQPTAIYKVTVKATGQTFYAAPSGADDGFCYRIEHHPGHYSCTCPDATYRQRACKHLQAFTAYLKEKRQAATQAASAPCADAEASTAAWGDYQEARQDSYLYRPVAARAQADDYGDRADYVPSDYYSHAYR